MWNRSKIEAAKAGRMHARVAVDAVARLSNDSSVMSCIIEDISAAGARLRLEGDAAAGLFGDGWVLSATLIGSIPIEIRWRNVDHAGVLFDIDQETRAQLNRFVKAVIRYGINPPQPADLPSPQDRGKRPFSKPRFPPPTPDRLMERLMSDG